MNPPNFFAELKRRNVIRVAGLYLVGAWLLIQVASTVFPTFDPMLASLHDDPRFAALVKKMGFEE